MVQPHYPTISEVTVPPFWWASTPHFPHLAILHGGNLNLLGARDAARLPLLRAAEILHLSQGASEAWRHVGSLRNQVVSSVGDWEMGEHFRGTGGDGEIGGTL